MKTDDGRLQAFRRFVLKHIGLLGSGIFPRHTQKDQRRQPHPHLQEGYHRFHENPARLLELKSPYPGLREPYPVKNSLLVPF